MVASVSHFLRRLGAWSADKGYRANWLPEQQGRFARYAGSDMDFQLFELENLSLTRNAAGMITSGITFFKKKLAGFRKEKTKSPPDRRA
jgi:hypothetical protein